MTDHTTKIGNSTPTLFVSYRRADGFAADQLVQTLQHEFGQHRVIQDTLSFEPGASFPKEIERCVRDCRLMLVVIGPHWCGTDENSIMHRDDDWVRREVELAIESGRQLLPVLLSGTQMPVSSQLPETIHALLGSNALQLRTGEDSVGDLRRIVAVSRRYLPRDWLRVVGETAFMVAGTAAVGLGGALLGSKTLFSDYSAWQWPNILTGVALALTLPTLAVLGHLSRQSAAKWRKPLPLYRQSALQGASLAGTLLALAALAWPQVNHIDTLYASLESTRKEVPQVEELLSKVKAMPRNAGSEDILLVNHLLVLRKSTTLTEDAVNSTVNALAPYLKQPDTRRRLWATLMTAEAYRFVKRYDDQLVLYQQVAQDTFATDWQRWYAYMELGAINYQHKDDTVQARADWEKALKYRKTVGLLQNLAVLDEDDGKWDSANNHYKQAVDTLKAYKDDKQLATLADQESVLYANWCNMKRRQANLASIDGQAALRLEASGLCRKAVELYSPYLDAHWNLARLQFDAHEFNEADRSLRDTLEIIRNLANSAPESLNRYGYNVYGERYTLWLLVVSRFLSGHSLQDDEALHNDFRQQVVRLQPSVTKAVDALLTEMHDRDLKIDEDQALLAKMTQAHYL